MIITEKNQEIIDLIDQAIPSITDHDLKLEISQVGKVMHFDEGDIILDYGSFITHVPLLVKGTVKVVREDEEEGKELLLYYLSSGDTCSMSFTCCMMSKKSDIRTTAEEDTTIIAVPIQFMDEWMRKYQNWKDFIMTAYDMRMRELIYTIDSIAFKKMDERLLEYLEEKARLSDSTSISITHREIANDLNASREAVSRLLKTLEKKGMVKLDRNMIDLL